MEEKKSDLLKGIVIGVLISVFLCAGVFWFMTTKGMMKNNDAEVNGKINEMIGILDKNYVGGIEIDKVKEGIYEGLAEGVGDRYTSYFSHKDYQAFIETMSGHYAGIGVYIYNNLDDKMITVTAPIKGFSGEKAGILPEDKILKVNGREFSGVEIDEAISQIKGKPGTSVTLTIFRKTTGETFDVDVVRENIDIPTVEERLLEDGIGYIKITSFDDNTAAQFEKALEKLEAEGEKALIIDVRNNLGGYLNRVVEICDMLLPESTIVYRENKEGKRKYEYSTDKKAFDRPMVLLVNNGSASASEILAGALKDNNAAELVGTTTYGKGLVQQLFKLSDGSAIKVTVEKYYTPSGICINGIGIEPNHWVELPKEFVTKAEISDEDDTQLQKAISVIKEKLE